MQASSLYELVGLAGRVQVPVVYHRAELGATAPLTINTTVKATRAGYITNKQPLTLRSY